MKRADRIKALLKQYDELIRYLKSIGGLLNTLRPQYLLSFSDYTSFLKLYPFEYSSNSQHRLKESRFNYISIDSWILLCYQILKLFLLNRINSKSVKFPNTIPLDKISFPDYSLEGCNYMSNPEGVLLRWLEINYEFIKNPRNIKRIRNFDNDIKDCHYFASVIQSYVGVNASKSLTSLKAKCQGDDEYKFNAERVMSALGEIGMQSHITSKDLHQASGRELILFVIQLYNNLHHYIPKNQPIIFSCVLGDEVTKNIELINPSNKPISYWVALKKTICYQPF